ncbi:hypothetical protein IW967_11775 [Alicyclobacillus mali]|uniref:YtxH-like protein n=1 Tax=Alicyclobacillus mali (ex Roth et al. 2021) TaxID=1123961 RepID=A0ABS0F5H9_9BACL|nr:hypothetical protein [Alicyclobacillus mali (ex Roth et al. 2021)]MBF8378532.1 hypothetical protein [Alicyclobacillus mali (ex Roth et al. 2021)]MCL6488660.1 hypothetical protein [Alicyclobacillus mali (ex Roth et al. 2021)]
MWNMMNAMSGMARGRMNWRRRDHGMGTMTALLIGASVGIAAWEAVRQMQNKSSMPSGAQELAQQMMDEIRE